MSEQELKRLRRAVVRLTEAQVEALDNASQATRIWSGLDASGLDLDDEARLLEESQHLKAALVDVQAILQGTSEDVVSPSRRRWWCMERSGHGSKRP